MRTLAAHVRFGRPNTEGVAYICALYIVRSVTVEERTRTKNAKRFRTLSRGYQALNKDKSAVYEAAANALEGAEKRSKRALDARLGKKWADGQWWLVSRRDYGKWRALLIWNGSRAHSFSCNECSQ